MGTGVVEVAVEQRQLGDQHRELCEVGVVVGHPGERLLPDRSGTSTVSPRKRGTAPADHSALARLAASQLWEAVEQVEEA